MFDGEISTLYKDDDNLFEVTYTDGDQEDLDAEEVECGMSLCLRDFGKE